MRSLRVLMVTTVLVVAGSATSLTAPAGAQSSSEATPGVTDKTIRVGAVVGKTNPTGAPYADVAVGAEAYFDAVNFARKFKGKSVLSVGFIDTACPPTSVYAAFNVLPEPKVMVAAPRLGHSTDPKYGPARDELWKKNLALQPPQ